MRGGGGNDLLEGGRDNDTLTGGGQSDIFLYRDPGGSDTIRDFNSDEHDAIWISDAVVDDFSDITVGDDGGGNAVVSWNAGGDTVQVTLLGIAPAAVTEDMFIFFPFG